MNDYGTILISMYPPTHPSISTKYQLKRWQIVLLACLVIIFFMILLLGILRLAYQGRFLPGVRLYGVYIGGLTQQEAQSLIEKKTQQYIESSTIIISSEKTQQAVSVPAAEVELAYSIQDDLEYAYQQGREGQLPEQFTNQVSLLLGMYPSSNEHVSYNAAKFYTILQPISKDMSSPSENATYTTNKENTLSVNAAQNGSRMNLTQLIENYTAIIASLQRSNITATSTTQTAAVTSAILEEKKINLQPFVHTPMALTFEKQTWTIPTNELLSWLSYSDGTLPLRQDIINNYYQQRPDSMAQIGLDTSRIKSYLNLIAKDVNQKAINATLTVEGERATVFQQSQDGRSIDLEATAKDISTNVLATTHQATIPLTVVVTKADITSDTIDQLGIKELLSEGVSYFPGSSANRLTNIRVGAKRYNGVLLKPGQTFSFGEILGKVGPEQGYKEGRVILEGRTESQYGGGLCQVSSTAFRAALLAGLPILERYNHSFAVEYYTAPYGVPGVDATIYYPQVDFKFKNDTQNYILIQTELIGTTLKFRFYGTKEKSGVIRGPYFISGNNDATQPSKTVFYRDIVVNGQVSKTNTFYTTYRSSLDFPPVN